MKLSAVFARYLFQQKHLSLPGIGVFSVDPAMAVPDPSDKNYQEAMRQIRFEQKPVLSADESLINFIRTETGKIKPLAESDLDSYLSDGKILLNIGKPFHIEGIGSLMKTKSGTLEFTAGGLPAARMEGFYNEPAPDEPRNRSVFTEDRTSPASSQKLLIAAAVVVGLILVVWGGYALYHHNSGEDRSDSTAPAVVAPAPVDTPRASVLLDSARKFIDAQATQSSSIATTYKFIIERTANKQRALKRFRQLSDGRTGIKMETSDSTMFSLYFTLPAAPADTARIRDSLRTWYARKQVFVEPS